MPRKKKTSYLPVPMEHKVTVKLQKSNLKAPLDQEIHYGQVEQRRFTMENAIADIEDKKLVTLPKEVVWLVATQLSQVLLHRLSQGYAIDLLNLGTLRLAVEGKIDSATTNKELSNKLAVSFSPSRHAKKAIKDIKVEGITKPNPSHFIQSIESLAPVVEQEKLTEKGIFPTIMSQHLARLKGRAIKIGQGEEHGVYFIPHPRQEIEKHHWYKSPLVVTNKPKEVIFTVPQIKPGKYQLVLVTNISASGNKLKKDIEITFGPVEVVSSSS